jgi:hypothetical protein
MWSNLGEILARRRKRSNTKKIDKNWLNYVFVKPWQNIN